MGKDIAKIIGRKLSGDFSHSDQADIDNWLGKDKSNQQYLSQLNSYWELPVEEEQLEHSSIVYQSLIHRVRNQREVLKSVGVLWKVAASVLFIISLSLTAYLLQPRQQGAVMFMVQTEAGQRSQAELPDGTKVWLNSGTQLFVEEGFGTSERNIRLIGEAMFKVSHDKDKPFNVEADDIRIQVLGTTFNVRSYENEENLQTTLMEGLVKVIQLDSDEHVLLKPGETALYNKNNGSLQVANVDVQAISSWQKGILIFKKTQFNQVIRRLEHVYGVKVNYNAADFSDVHFTGTLDNLRLEQVFEFISYFVPLKYKIDKQTVTVIKNK
ncbi:MAG: FecR domain-containing protein [Carboxylicivirga sp.]|jgi:ferric-dicitrate binding protein FerR (iron transport regulator)|nr:FecR domain-containing protein [Carboxylicivirga sp.]